jgi:hypothetical protein
MGETGSGCKDSCQSRQKDPARMENPFSCNTLKLFAAKRFTQLVEKNEVATMQYWQSLEYSSGRITKDFHSFLTDTSKYVYKLFPESDGEGTNFSSKLSQLMDRVSASGYYRPEDVNRYNEVLTNAYYQAINAIS